MDAPPDRPDLSPWPGLEAVGRLPGGHRGGATLARRGSADYVVRPPRRPVAALEWELDLQADAAVAGVRVPRLLLTGDGRRHVGGLVVEERVAGRPPADHRDWAGVRDTLLLLHEATRDRPQRPGFAPSAELARRRCGGDVDLDALPDGAAAVVLEALAAVDDGARAAVHGDPGPGNVVLGDDGATLLDWDECRVDLPWLDLAGLPEDVPVPMPVGVDREALARAGLAWEVASCWRAEPAYATRCLERLRRS